ncbi:uncharacterized protein LOC141914074 isoform X2 [Tubulanus polymorphus]|uniref:uncharacterized protein LOC141914074 isoform X2 n=1 Tax=Tubulanus polymorphus TaxID=672921 RepID=UPI003DA64D41
MMNSTTSRPSQSQITDTGDTTEQKHINTETTKQESSFKNNDSIRDKRDSSLTDKPGDLSLNNEFTNDKSTNDKPKELTDTAENNVSNLVAAGSNMAKLLVSGNSEETASTGTKTIANSESPTEEDQAASREEGGADAVAESDSSKTGGVKKKKPTLTPEALDAEVRQHLNVLRTIRDDIGNDTCLTAIKRLSRLYFLNKTRKIRKLICSILLEDNFADLAINILKVGNNQGVFSSDKIWFPVYYSYNTLWNYTDASKEFANQLAEKDLVKLLCLNLEHKPYKENMSSKNVYYILKSSMSILHNVCRSHEARTFIDSTSVINVVRFYINCDREFLSVLSALIIAYLTTEKDVAENESLLVQNDDVIKKVVKWMSSALKMKNHRMKGFSTTELAQGLGKLSVVDANKMKIVEADALPILQDMIDSKTASVQRSAVELLWSLAFDSHVKTKILEIDAIVSRLDELSKTSDNQEVKDAATGALWVLRKRDAEAGSTGAGDAVLKPDTTKDGHIFISYNWDNQETILKIRDFLRAAGLKVWIDVDHMSDNLLESMALAVENASIVLICMSEKYKESPNCRTEGEYSFQQRKPLIPLLMQKRYRADGWLGALVGMKLYLNFSSPHLFDTMSEKLLSEIRNKLSLDEVVIPKEVSDRVHHVAAKPSFSSPPAAAAAAAAAVTEVETWTEDDVQNWLKNNKLKTIADAFKNIDGPKLISMQKIRHEAASFFYEKLEKSFEMEFVDILSFISVLDNLNL